MDYINFWFRINFIFFFVWSNPVGRLLRFFFFVWRPKGESIILKSYRYHSRVLVLKWCQRITTDFSSEYCFFGQIIIFQFRCWPRKIDFRIRSFEFEFSVLQLQVWQLVTQISWDEAKSGRGREERNGTNKKPG